MPVKEPSVVYRELFGAEGIAQIPVRPDGSATETTDIWNPVKSEARETAQDMWDRLGVTERTGKPFTSRAAFEAATIDDDVQSWSIISGQVPASSVCILDYRREATGTAITSANGVKGSPLGFASPNHWQENTVPGTTDMLAAFNSAKAFSPAVRLLDQEYFISDTVDMTRNASSIIGRSKYSGAVVTIAPTSTVPAFIIAKANPAVDGFVSNVELKGFTIQGGSNTLRTRHIVEVLRGERTNIDIRTIGCYSGLLFQGGQFNSVTGYKHGGGGLATVVGGTSIFRIEPFDMGGGSYETPFTLNVQDFHTSSGANLGTEFAWDIRGVDGLNVSQGYCAMAGTAMVNLSPTVSGAIAATYFSNVYLDGVNTSTGAPVGVRVPSGASAGNISATFSNCFFGQYTGDILDVNNTSVHDLVFDTCAFANASGDLGSITGSATNTRVTFTGACKMANAGPLTLSTLESLNISALTMDNISGANPLILTGVISHKDYNGLQLINCGGPISDVATGSTLAPISDWYADIPYTPALTFTGGSTGITYTTQLGSCVRIGKTYHFAASIVLSSKGTSTGQVRVSMPASIGADAVAVSLYATSLAGATPSALYAFVNFNSAKISSMTSGATTQLTDANLTNTSQIYLSGTLTVA